jgi:hypothetical protein
MFYCLRFETSLFVASYDSEGDNGGIRARNGSWFSLHSLGTDRTENTASKIDSIDGVLYSRYMVMAVSLAPQSFLCHVICGHSIISP